jgi:hypothetical protein
MVGTERGIHAQLAGKSARRTPGKNAGEREQYNTNHYSPDGQRTGPEPTLPQAGESQKLQQDSPPGAPINHGGSCGFLMRGDKGIEPDNNSGKDQRVNVGAHGGRRQSRLLPLDEHLVLL